MCLSLLQNRPSSFWRTEGWRWHMVMVICYDSRALFSVFPKRKVHIVLFYISWTLTGTIITAWLFLLLLYWMWTSGPVLASSPHFSLSLILGSRNTYSDAVGEVYGFRPTWVPTVCGSAHILWIYVHKQIYLLVQF